MLYVCSAHTAVGLLLSLLPKAKSTEACLTGSGNMRAMAKLYFFHLLITRCLLQSQYQTTQLRLVMNDWGESF